MNVYYNMKRRRLELGLSQGDLARILGYKSRSTIAKIEAGQNDIPLSKLLPLARALDTTVDHLLSGEPDIGSVGALKGENRSGKTHRVGVILAGGKSSRNQKNIPNQFISVQGKPVFLYSVEVYQRHSAIDDLYIVCAEEWRGIVEDYARKHGITKFMGAISAGKSGIESVRNATKGLVGAGRSRKDVIVFQEATRPFISEEVISKLLLACKKSDGAVVCERRDDHVQFLVDGPRQMYLDRYKVVDLQSPEAYTLGTLIDLFEKAREVGHHFEESCLGMLMFNMGFKLNFIDGERNNFKIVRQEDMVVFEALLRSR